MLFCGSCDGQHTVSQIHFPFAGLGDDHFGHTGALNIECAGLTETEFVDGLNILYGQAESAVFGYLDNGIVGIIESDVNIIGIRGDGFEQSGIGLGCYGLACGIKQQGESGATVVAHGPVAVGINTYHGSSSRHWHLLAHCVKQPCGGSV